MADAGVRQQVDDGQDDAGTGRWPNRHHLLPRESRNGHWRLVQQQQSAVLARGATEKPPPSPPSSVSSRNGTTEFDVTVNRRSNQ